MHEWITTIGVSLLTLLALAGSVMAVISLIAVAQPVGRQTQAQTPAQSQSQSTDTSQDSPAVARPLPIFAVSLAVGIGALVLYLHRWLLIRGDWQPLESHVDGLLLVTFLFMMAVIYLDRRARIGGIYAFALPVATLLLAWAICASSWTMEIFAIGQFVKGLHIVCVYLGSLFLCLAAVAGGMYLYVQRLLRNKQNFRLLHRLASLEALETLIVRASGIGFAVLTLGLVTGLIVVTSGPGKLGPGWWYTPKVLLAVGAWAVYALVINLRHSTLFRGSRAAWLAIFGAVLLFATFGAVTAMREAPMPESKNTNKPEELCCVPCSRTREHVLRQVLNNQTCSRVREHGTQPFFLTQPKQPTRHQEAL